MPAVARQQRVAVATYGGQRESHVKLTVMSARERRQTAEEMAIFQAFLCSFPSLQMKIVKFEPCKSSFPDIIAKFDDHSEVDFELSEWLQDEQMHRSKSIERLELCLLNALGNQADNLYSHFRNVMLHLRADPKRFRPRDGGAFRSELYMLLEETDQRWEAERFWRSPQGYTRKKFESYPTVAKFLRSVHFSPSQIGNKAVEPWPAGQPWIFFKLWGGPYSSMTALNALLEAIEKKQNHYGNQSTRPMRLLIYYDKAVLYNTPYLDVDVRGFADVAKFAANALTKTQMIFEKIYLFHALEPDLQAFEIYPTLLKCS